MTKLNREQLEEIVSEFGHLIDTPYSEEFCWEADVGNMFSPLSFAEDCAGRGACDTKDLIYKIEFDANIAADHLADIIAEQDAQLDPDQVVERDLSNLPNDILRNIAIDAKEALEDLDGES